MLLYCTHMVQMSAASHPAITHICEAARIPIAGLTVIWSPLLFLPLPQFSVSLSLSVLSFSLSPPLFFLYLSLCSLSALLSVTCVTTSSLLMFHAARCHCHSGALRIDLFHANNLKVYFSSKCIDFPNNIVSLPYIIWYTFQHPFFKKLNMLRRIILEIMIFVIGHTILNKYAVFAYIPHQYTEVLLQFLRTCWLWYVLRRNIRNVHFSHPVTSLLRLCHVSNIFLFQVRIGKHLI